MSKAFASQADLADKTVSFDRLSDRAYAYTAEGDPNTGIVIGDDVVLVADTQATPVMAQDVLARIRGVTNAPVKYVVLTHYHAVRVLGASGYAPQEIIAIRRPNALERNYFPYNTLFRQAFRIRFPRVTAVGRPTISSAAKWFGLRFAGAQGNVQLIWNIEGEKSANGAKKSAIDAVPITNL